MSYQHATCVELYGMQGGPATHVQTHQDRGDGTALCAVGTQYPNPDDWRAVGRGEVNCLLCGQSNTPEGRAGARVQKGIPVDPGIAMSLDERIARRKAKQES